MCTVERTFGDYLPGFTALPRILKQFWNILFWWLRPDRLIKGYKTITWVLRYFISCPLHPEKVFVPEGWGFRIPQNKPNQTFPVPSAGTAGQGPDLLACTPASLKAFRVFDVIACLSRWFAITCTCSSERRPHLNPPHDSSQIHRTRSTITGGYHQHAIRRQLHLFFKCLLIKNRLYKWSHDFFSQDSYKTPDFPPCWFTPCTAVQLPLIGNRANIRHHRGIYVFLFCRCA